MQQHLWCAAGAILRLLLPDAPAICPPADRGKLLLDCESLDGSSSLQCFVDGLDVAQDCADTRNYPTELAATLFAQGKGVDGQEGSMCATNAPSAQAANTSGALLPNLPRGTMAPSQPTSVCSQRLHAPVTLA